MTTAVRLLYRLCVVGVWIAASCALATEASLPKLQQEATFHIERAPLESALIQFSRQAEVQVVLAPNVATHLLASRVHGRFIASAALTALLKGTGLVYTTVGNTVMVQLAGTPKPATHGARSEESKVVAAQEPDAAP